MPSPPRPTRSSHQSIAGDIAGSSPSRRAAWRLAPARAAGLRQPLRDLHVPQLVAVEVHRALGGQDVEGRDLQIVHAAQPARHRAPRLSHRPRLVQPARQPVAQRFGWHAARERPRRRFALPRGRPGRRRRPAHTGPSCRLDALADQGMISASSNSQSVPSSSQSPAARRLREPGEQRLRRRASAKKGRPVRVQMRRPHPSTVPKRRRAAWSSRQSAITAREPMCFSSSTTSSCSRSR